MLDEERGNRLHYLTQAIKNHISSDESLDSSLLKLSKAELFEVIAELLSDGSRGEVYLDAKQMDEAKIHSWIESWVQTGDWYPDEILDHAYSVY